MVKKKKKQKDPLDGLIEAADKKLLNDLIRELVPARPGIRRACIEFFQKHMTLTPEQKVDADAETVLALWNELAFDLSELDEYGGGEYDEAYQVAALLDELKS